MGDPPSFEVHRRDASEDQDFTDLQILGENIVASLEKTDEERPRGSLGRQKLVETQNVLKSNGTASPGLEEMGELCTDNLPFQHRSMITQLLSEEGSPRRLNVSLKSEGSQEAPSKKTAADDLDVHDSVMVSLLNKLKIESESPTKPKFEQMQEPMPPFQPQQAYFQQPIQRPHFHLDESQPFGQQMEAMREFYQRLSDDAYMQRMYYLERQAQFPSMNFYPPPTYGQIEQ